jgi:flagellin
MALQTTLPVWPSASRMQAQIRGLNQGVRNANDATAMIQTAEGSPPRKSRNMLERMRELSVQAANDTYGSEDRAAIQTSRLTSWTKRFTRIATNTEWNGKKILGVDADATTYTYQVGAGSTTLRAVSSTFDAMNVRVLLDVHSLSMGSFCCSADFDQRD